MLIFITATLTNLLRINLYRAVNWLWNLGNPGVRPERSDRTEEGSPRETGEVIMTIPLSISTSLHRIILSGGKTVTPHSHTSVV